METEFKYNVNDPTVFDRIVENAEINKMGLEAVETIDMRAVYFDTPEMDFIQERSSIWSSMMRDLQRLLISDCLSQVMHMKFCMKLQETANFTERSVWIIQENRSRSIPDDL